MYLYLTPLYSRYFCLVYRIPVLNSAQRGSQLFRLFSHFE